MATTEILKNIYWVGAVDWNIRDFHGYSTRRGTTLGQKSRPVV